jgi:hypothetical protein
MRAYPMLLVGSQKYKMYTWWEVYYSTLNQVSRCSSRESLSSLQPTPARASLRGVHGLLSLARMPKESAAVPPICTQWGPAAARHGWNVWTGNHLCTLTVRDAGHLQG